MEPPVSNPDSLYRQICETTAQGIWVLDLAHRFTYANASLARMFGCRPDELMGRSILDFISTEEREDFLRNWPYRDNHGREEHPLRLQGPAGRVLFALVHATPLVGEHGEFCGQFALVCDVTERQEAERRLEERAEAARSLFEHNPDPIYVLDCDAHFREVNQAAETLSGYTRAELLGMSWPPLVKPEDLETCVRAFETAKSGEPAHYEAHLIHRDGHHIPISGTSFPLIIRGQICGVYGVAKDISTLKRVEASLKFLSEASAALGRSLNYPEILQCTASIAVPTLGTWCLVIVQAANGSFHMAGAARDAEAQQVLQRFCTQPPSLPRAGEAIAELVDHIPATLFSEVDAALLSRVAPSEEHLRLLLQLAPTSLVYTPLRDHGQVRGMLLAACDPGREPYATEHLQVARELAQRAAIALENAYLHAELQRIDRHKDEFLALLGHELRNPLASICSAVEILLRVGSKDRRACRAVETIKRQVWHEARLIEDLLNVSRIAEGKLQLRPERVDLTDVIRSVLDDHTEILRIGELRLEVAVPEEPVWVWGDPTRLAQIVTNLLHNASKFTDRGGQVSVRVAPRPEVGDVLVEILDTGIGIDPVLLPHLFEPFVQVEGTRERSRSGLGLGLALVKGLVELHGGTVSACSAGPGRGAAFQFTLPLDVTEPSLSATGAGVRSSKNATREAPTEPPEGNRPPGGGESLEPDEANDSDTADSTEDNAAGARAAGVAETSE